MFNGVFIIRLVGWGIYWDWEWDIFVYCEEVIRAGTWDVEEDGHMRHGLIIKIVDSVQDGFITLPNGANLTAFHLVTIIPPESMNLVEQ